MLALNGSQPTYTFVVTSNGEYSRDESMQMKLDMMINEMCFAAF